MNEQKLKSYWNRPGGKFGTVAALAGLGALGWWVLPILTAIIWNTINFGIACVVGAVLAYCLSHRKLRMSAFYFYEWLMKQLVGVIIQLDPFLIAEDIIRDMRKYRAKVGEERDRVEGHKEQIALKIEERERQKQKALDKARAAKDAGNGLALSAATADAARCEEFIKKLSPMRNDLDVLGNHLTRFYDNGQVLINDAESKLEIEKDMYQTVTLGSNAMASALRFMDGDLEKRMMADQAADALRQNMGDKMAYMKRGLRQTTEMINSIDLDQATLAQQGLRMLEEYTNPANFIVGQQVEAVPVAIPVTKHRDLLS